MVNRFGNLLSHAMSIIPPVRFEYRHYLDREITDLGIQKNRYSEWKKSVGIICPGRALSFASRSMSEKQYSDFGLEFSAGRISVFTCDNINNIKFGESCDQIRYNGRTYNVTDCSDWEYYDGWKAFYCVEVQNEQ